MGRHFRELLRERLPALSALDSVLLVRDLEVINWIKIWGDWRDVFLWFAGVFEGCLGKSGVFGMVNSW
jgi:hypothetical protein